MRTEKMSLLNVQGKLSREEMKSVMGGNPPVGCIQIGYVCSKIFEDVCCNSGTCKGDSGSTSNPGVCSL